MTTLSAQDQLLVDLVVAKVSNVNALFDLRAVDDRLGRGRRGHKDVAAFDRGEAVARRLHVHVQLLRHLRRKFFRSLSGKVIDIRLFQLRQRRLERHQLRLALRARAEKADGLRARGRHILGANARYCAGADRTDECAVHDGNGYLGLGIVQHDHGRAARQAEDLVQALRGRHLSQLHSAFYHHKSNFL